MPIFIALSGFHNSGKTTLGEFIVSELVKRGYKVAVVKSTKEEALQTDKVLSDTYRYRKAGAQMVSLLQKDLITLYISNTWEKDNLIEYLERLFWDHHLVLLEGFKTVEGVPKIWLLRPTDEVEEILKKYKNIELLIDLSEKDKVLSYFEGKLKNSSPSISLWVNSKKIFLKPFIQVILENIILGFLKGLRDIPEKVFQIEVKIKK